MSECWFNVEEEILCERCLHSYKLKDFIPSLGVYNDINCPNCGSTKNTHNREFSRRIQDGLKKR